MKKVLLIGACVAAVAACLAGGATAAPNLIVNGSFETGYPGDGICGGWWYQVGYGCNTNNSSIPGWTQTGNGVDWHNTPPNPLEPAAQDGVHTIDLVGDNDAGAIAQTISTSAGASYALTFYYAGHPFCLLQSGGTASATASAGSASITVTSGPTNVYTQVALPFTASGSSTTVSFTSLTSTGCGGVLIDNVSVVLLPSSKDECKNGGWQQYGVFKNQGDCVSFVATHGKNQPSG